MVSHASLSLEPHPLSSTIYLAIKKKIINIICLKWNIFARFSVSLKNYSNWPKVFRNFKSGVPSHVYVILFISFFWESLSMYPEVYIYIDTLNLLTLFV